MVDPPGRNAQVAALGQLQAIANAQGMDPQFRAAVAQSQAATATQERASRGAILDTFARRGAGNSNSALLAALMAQQGGAQRGGIEGLQAAGQASARQSQAIADSGSLGSTLRAADYGQASDKANAMDRVAQYNPQQRQAVKEIG